MNFILVVKRPFKIQRVYFMRGGMKKVNKNIFLFVDPILRVLVNGNRTIETVTKMYLNQRTKLVHNYSTRAASTECLHYNKVNTTKYGINSFKYQGVQILNDLKKINIYQNNVSKYKFWKELKSKLLSNYIA